MMKHKRLKRKRWRTTNKTVGRLYGYPPCCVKSFYKHYPDELRWLYPYVKRARPRKRHKLRTKAAYINGQYTGFIPCYKCAKKVLSGKIELKDLIGSRLDSFGEFPIISKNIVALLS